MNIKLSWQGGFKTPSDECRFMLSKGHIVKSEKEIDKTISQLPIVPKWHVGFIPSEYFYTLFKNKESLSDNNAIILDAWQYSMKMQCGIPFNELMSNKVDISMIIKTNFILKFLLELLSRNKNVELKLDSELVEYVFGLLQLENDIKALKKIIDNIPEGSINDIVKVCKINGKTLSIEFNPKQGVHQFVGYPRY